MVLAGSYFLSPLGANLVINIFMIHAFYPVLGQQKSSHASGAINILFSFIAYPRIS